MNNYIANEINYQVILPLNLAVMIPADDSVRLLPSILENHEILKLLAASDNRQRVKVPARVLLKVLVYGYMNRLHSSRDIARACRRDINFMWLLEGYPPPDHNTLSRFRGSIDIQGVFTQALSSLRK